METNEAMRRIRAGLRKRTGRSWLVWQYPGETDVYLGVPPDRRRDPAQPGFIAQRGLVPGDDYQILLGALALSDPLASSSNQALRFASEKGQGVSLLDEMVARAEGLETRSRTARNGYAG